MMKVIKTLAEMRQWRRQISNKKVAFVPTMGYLHEGHLSLIRKAHTLADTVVVSIYVNPTQFAAGEDLDKYPRDFERDEKLCTAENVDCIFYPSNGEMYLPQHKTFIVTEELSSKLCGQTRPTHFRGVTTIVAKLFNLVKPHSAVFGQKDAQQAIIIQRMVEDLNIDTEVVIAPIVREADGLAMSSRNKYLNVIERAQAPVLQQSLQMARNEIETGNKNFEQIKQKMQQLIREKSESKIDYIAFSDTESLEPADKNSSNILIALAVYFGATRLIDNIVVNIH